MDNRQRFVRHVMKDMAIVAVVSGVIGWIVIDWLYGVSVTIGCVWIASNFFLLAWWIGMTVSPHRVPKLYIFLVFCAKLPVSYVLLWWLFQVKYFEASGLAIGICFLPAVLLVRGLISGKDGCKHTTNIEEGK